MEHQHHSDDDHGQTHDGHGPHQHHTVKRAHPEQVVLDIGGEVGAMVLYTPPELVHQEIEVSPRHDEGHRTHTEVLERRIQDCPVYAAVYLALPAGEYRIWVPDPTLLDTVTIVGGQVAEVDWR